MKTQTQFFLVLPPLWAGVLAPLLIGVIHRTKAFFAGRVGVPWFQVYFDLIKLLRKGVVYSRTTTVIFRLGPLVSLAALITALLLVPFGGWQAPLAFTGDLILFIYLLGLSRFFIVLAALDTGSSFEGMGASREVMFSMLVEPCLILSLMALAVKTGSWSLSGIFERLSCETWMNSGAVLSLVVIALMVVFLVENSRVPVDDPNTHLELTMIHEVMVLDHGGLDFVWIMYGTVLKMWIFGACVVHVLLPISLANRWLEGVVFVAGMLGIAILTGVVESSMARLRLTRIPQFLVGAGVLSAMALLLAMRK